MFLFLTTVYFLSRIYLEANEYIRRAFLYLIPYPPNVWAIKIVEFTYKGNGKTALGFVPVT